MASANRMSTGRLPLPGHCGSLAGWSSRDRRTRLRREFNCSKGHSGVFFTDRPGSSLDECVLGCERCERCRFVSYSKRFGDCSWYETCPLLVKGDAGRAIPTGGKAKGRRGHEGRGGARAARRPSCERVVYLDSDVYVLHPNRSLGALLDCADATLSVFKNAPYDGRELSAVMVWRNGGVHAQRSRELLSEWWGTGRFRHLHHAHPFEQDALQKELAVRFPGEVAVLPHLDHWFAHVGSFPPGTANQRAQRMRDHVRAHGIEPRVALSVLEHGEDMVMERMGASE